MGTVSGKGYLVRRLQDAPTVRSECGQSTRPLSYPETAVCNLHVTFIKDSTRHYHKQCTEVYYILDGRGKTILDGETYEWRAGDLINTPLRPDGVTVQHFNTGSEMVRFIEASPNLVHALGVDRGSGDASRVGLLRESQWKASPYLLPDCQFGTLRLFPGAAPHCGFDRTLYGEI